MQVPVPGDTLERQKRAVACKATNLMLRRHQGPLDGSSPAQHSLNIGIRTNWSPFRSVLTMNFIRQDVKKKA
jgi:hypothetical protein